MEPHPRFAGIAELGIELNNDFNGRAQSSEPLQKHKRMAQEDNKQKKLNIDLPEELAQGIYSNLAVITHSPVEFVVDFAQVMPGMKQAQVRSRILLAPHHAKRLLHALNENIQRFEQQQGPIQPPKGNQDPAMPLTFSGPQGEA